MVLWREGFGHVLCYADLKLCSEQDCSVCAAVLLCQIAEGYLSLYMLYIVRVAMLTAEQCW